MIRKAAWLLPSTKIGMVVTGDGPWGHSRKRCPCTRCCEHRKRSYTPSVFKQMQDAIKMELYQNIQLSREMETYI